MAKTMVDLRLAYNVYLDEDFTGRVKIIIPSLK